MKIKSDLILLLAAIIWGFAFVAQRVGMNYVGPFTYNGVRFSLGVLVLLPFLIFRIKGGTPLFTEGGDVRKIIAGSVFTGLLLFGGVGFQQLGLMYTTAGKAGFITGLYVVMVPLVGLFFGHKSGWPLWIGAMLAVAGLYFLTIRGEMTFNPGDQLVLACAVVFTFHVLFIGWLAPAMDSFLLAIIQFSVCAFLNLVISFLYEPVTFASVVAAWLPIAYGGILSVGVAYTLQVVAQKTAHPAYASIILSLEAVFAVLGGWMILSEELTPKMVIGCGLMLAGMIVVQVRTGTS
jgi:drug/metabolite transporter (DMT)-like permease